MLVEADRSQLEQVIVNLAVNARDAMPDGGRLDDRGLNLARTTDGAATGECCCVSRQRQRDGRRDRAHVFEPFFTTKGADGTGFGLATVHGIVSQSGGRIVLDSTPAPARRSRSSSR